MSGTNQINKIIINGIEQQPIDKFKLHEILTEKEINAAIIKKQLDNKNLQNTSK